MTITLSKPAKVKTFHRVLTSGLDNDHSALETAKTHDAKRRETIREIEKSRGFVYFLDIKDIPMGHTGWMHTHFVYIVKR